MVGGDEHDTCRFDGVRDRGVEHQAQDKQGADHGGSLGKPKGERSETKGPEGISV
jgi:hypothetical protein